MERIRKGPSHPAPQPAPHLHAPRGPRSTSLPPPGRQRQAYMSGSGPWLRRMRSFPSPYPATHRHGPRAREDDRPLPPYRRATRLRHGQRHEEAATAKDSPLPSRPELNRHLKAPRTYALGLFPSRLRSTGAVRGGQWRAWTPCAKDCPRPPFSRTSMHRGQNHSPSLRPGAGRPQLARSDKDAQWPYPHCPSRPPLSRCCPTPACTANQTSHILSIPLTLKCNRPNRARTRRASFRKWASRLPLSGSPMHSSQSRKATPPNRPTTGLRRRRGNPNMMLGDKQPPVPL